MNIKKIDFSNVTKISDKFKNTYIEHVAILSINDFMEKIWSFDSSKYESYNKIEAHNLMDMWLYLPKDTMKPYLSEEDYNLYLDGANISYYKGDVDYYLVCNFVDDILYSAYENDIKNKSVRDILIETFSRYILSREDYIKNRHTFSNVKLEYYKFLNKCSNKVM